MPFLFLGIPLCAVVVLNILSWRDRRSALWVAMIVVPAQVGLAAWDLYRCLSTGRPVTSSFFGSFAVDAFTAVVLGIIGFVAGAAALVAHATVRHNRFSFGNALLLLMMGMNGTAMVTDLFSLYVFTEATAAASFLLIAINKRRDELEGAFKYYLLSALVTVMMLSSIALLFALTGQTSFEAVAAYMKGFAGGEPPALLRTAVLLFTVALCVKSGAVPFHAWVPDAHSSAPSAVSVVLAGVVIKVSGVYSLMRLFRDVFLRDAGMAAILTVLGLASIVVGALAAMGQSDIKRTLAFSSVSQIGYILLGLSTGSALGFAGAAFHFFNHATFKSLLFVSAAAVANQTGTRDMNAMGGLSDRMPVTSVSSVLGLLSMSGIPPLSGFWSKLLVIVAVWRLSPALALAALLSSVLTLAYFLRLQRKVFFGKLAPGMEAVSECGGTLRLVQVALSAVNVIAGVAFPFLLTILGGMGML